MSTGITVLRHVTETEDWLPVTRWNYGALEGEGETESELDSKKRFKDCIIQGYGKSLAVSLPALTTF